ncbi:MAG: sulfotransferase, partial [Actinomycetota bacterium]|nr:sulfotransferase [Actinomycetota bacterium]
WVGKMLEASGEVVYVNEPLNPQHPPGLSPGVLDAEVTHRYQYICAENERPWLPAFRDTLRLRYRPLAELHRNRGLYDLARMAKYSRSFTVGRLRGRRAMLDDPWALVSVPWLVERMGCEAVVLVRRPAAVAGSWRKLGWQVRFDDLLDQPLLVRDVLGRYAGELRALRESPDWIARIALLWNAMYDHVAGLPDRLPAVSIVRYEDLAADPVTGFRELYARLGLTWTGRVEAHVVTTTTAADSARVFGWNWRGGLSRTGYRPMDSRQSLTSYRQLLSPDEVSRIEDVTAEVAQRFYGSDPPAVPV